MVILNKYNEADILLDEFIKYKMKDYKNLRNFDYGVENPLKVVSGLSPFISKGIIKEKKILKEIYKSNNPCEKYIQEVFWRVYWKGWLEQNENVWEDYKKQLKIEQIKITEDKNYDLYKKAINGNTGIKPFDSWIIQLKSKGYLHNHARMWFASIWIHYFSLHWTLGANLFYENLLDADIASNILSWRWVAGIQTKGKKYIASVENINKYSLNNFKKFSLPTIKNIEINDNIKHSSSRNFEKYTNVELKKSSAILILENNLNLDFIKKYKDDIKYYIFLNFKSNDISNSSYKLSFHRCCEKDFIDICKKKKISISTFIINIQEKEFLEFLKKNKIKNIYSEYINIGYERDYIKKIKPILNKNSIYLYEILDSFYASAWRYCNKGYFNFKRNFKKITL